MALPLDDLYQVGREESRRRDHEAMQRHYQQNLEERLKSIQEDRDAGLENFASDASTFGKELIGNIGKGFQIAGDVVSTPFREAYEIPKEYIQKHYGPTPEEQNRAYQQNIANQGGARLLANAPPEERERRIAEAASAASPHLVSETVDPVLNQLPELPLRTEFAPFEFGAGAVSGIAKALADKRPWMAPVEAVRGGVERAGKSFGGTEATRDTEYRLDKQLPDVIAPAGGLLEMLASHGLGLPSQGPISGMIGGALNQDPTLVQRPATMADWLREQQEARGRATRPIQTALDTEEPAILQPARRTIGETAQDALERLSARAQASPPQSAPRMTAIEMLRRIEAMKEQRQPFQGFGEDTVGAARKPADMDEEERAKRVAHLDGKIREVQQQVASGYLGKDEGLKKIKRYSNEKVNIQDYEKSLQTPQQPQTPSLETRETNQPAIVAPGESGAVPFAEAYPDVVKYEAWLRRGETEPGGRFTEEERRAFSEPERTAPQPEETFEQALARMQDDARKATEYREFVEREAAVGQEDPEAVDEAKKEEDLAKRLADRFASRAQGAEPSTIIEDRIARQLDEQARERAGQQPRAQDIVRHPGDQVGIGPVLHPKLELPPREPETSPLPPTPQEPKAPSGEVASETFKAKQELTAKGFGIYQQERARGSTHAQAMAKAQADTYVPPAQEPRTLEPTEEERARAQQAAATTGARPRVRILGKLIAKGTSARVFETPEGDVIRVGPNIDRPKSPDILQPTSKTIRGEWMEEHLPKVTMGDVSIEEMADLEIRLRAQGLTLADMGSDNVGRTSDGRVVVVDPGAVVPIGSRSTGLEGDVLTWKRAYEGMTDKQLDEREQSLIRRKAVKTGEVEELPTDDPEFYHIEPRLEAIREIRHERSTEMPQDVVDTFEDWLKKKQQPTVELPQGEPAPGSEAAYAKHKAEQATPAPKQPSWRVTWVQNGETHEQVVPARTGEDAMRAADIDTSKGVPSGLQAQRTFEEEPPTRTQAPTAPPSTPPTRQPVSPPPSSAFTAAGLEPPEAPVVPTKPPVPPPPAPPKGGEPPEPEEGGEGGEPGPDREEEIFKKRLPPTLREQFSTRAAAFQKGWTQLFHYGGAADKAAPGYGDAEYVFKAKGRDIGRQVATKLQSVLSPDGKMLTPEEYDVFERIVNYRDFKATAESGVEKLPAGLTKEQVQQRLLDWGARANARVKKALAAHDALVEEERQDLIRRGKLKPDTKREAYFPHIFDPAELLKRDARDFANNKIVRPARGYTKQRLGSEKVTIGNYVEAMTQHLGRVAKDNAIDDFIDEVMSKWGQKVQRGKKPPDGYKQFTPRAAVTRITSRLEPKQQRILRAVLKDWEGSEKDQAVIEQLVGKANTGQLFGAMMKASRWLPEEVAKRLNTFYEMGPDHPFMDAVNKATRWTKAGLTVLAPAFQIHNTALEAASMWLREPKSFGWIPEAIRTQVRNARGQYDVGYDVARRLGVLFSGQMGADWRSAITNPDLRYYMTGQKPSLLSQAGRKVARVLSERENTARLAVFLKKADELAPGWKSGKADALVNDERMRSAAKEAREFAIDHNRMTDEERRYFSGAAIPFYNAFKQSIGNIAKWAKDDPWGMLARGGAMVGFAYLWNHTGDRKQVEDSLSDEERRAPHIVTGYKNSDGKAIILSSKMPWTDLVDIITNPIHTVFNAVNPLIKTPIELAANYQTFTGRPILGEEEQKLSPLERARLKAKYVVESSLPITRGLEPGGAPHNLLGLPVRYTDVERNKERRLADVVKQGAEDVQADAARRDIAMNRFLYARKAGRVEEMKQAAEEVKRLYRERWPDPQEARVHMLQDAEERAKQIKKPAWLKEYEKIPKEERERAKQGIREKLQEYRNR